MLRNAAAPISTVAFARGLADELTWQRAGLSAFVSEKYDEALERLLSDCLTAVSNYDSEGVAAIRLLTEKADSTQLRSALRDPYVAIGLLHPKHLERHSFWKSIFFVRLIRGLQPGFHSVQPGEWRTGTLPLPGFKRSELPFSYEGLPLPMMDRGGNEIRSLDAKSVERTMRKVRGAIGRIELVSKALFFFINGTELVCLRSEREQRNRFSSGSFRELPGLSVIFNPELDDADGATLADALLHEAIHGIIYKYEAFGARLTSGRQDVTICSPWTGSQLPLDSFAQACFVWFGLSNFWRNSESSPGSARLFARAAAGFNRDYLLRCGDARPHLAPGLFDVLADLYNYAHA